MSGKIDGGFMPTPDMMRTRGRTIISPSSTPKVSKKSSPSPPDPSRFKGTKSTSDLSSSESQTQLMSQTLLTKSKGHLKGSHDEIMSSGKLSSGFSELGISSPLSISALKSKSMNSYTGSSMGLQAKLTTYFDLDPMRDLSDSSFKYLSLEQAIARAYPDATDKEIHQFIKENRAYLSEGFTSSPVTKTPPPPPIVSPKVSPTVKSTLVEPPDFKLLAPGLDINDFNFEEQTQLALTISKLTHIHKDTVVGTMLDKVEDETIEDIQDLADFFKIKPEQLINAHKALFIQKVEALDMVEDEIELEDELDDAPPISYDSIQKTSFKTSGVGSDFAQKVQAKATSALSNLNANGIQYFGDGQFLIKGQTVETLGELLGSDSLVDDYVKALLKDLGFDGTDHELQRLRIDCRDENGAQTFEAILADLASGKSRLLQNIAYDKERASLGTEYDISGDGDCLFEHTLLHEKIIESGSYEDYESINTSGHEAYRQKAIDGLKKLLEADPPVTLPFRFGDEVIQMELSSMMDGGPEAYFKHMGKSKVSGDELMALGLAYELGRPVIIHGKMTATDDVTGKLSIKDQITTYNPSGSDKSPIELVNILDSHYCIFKPKD